MNDEKRKEFGKWLRFTRKKAGLSYTNISHSLGYQTRGQLVSVETGRAPLPIDKIDALAEALGISLDELLAKIEECEPELYAKYRVVEKGILRRFMGQLLGKGTSGSMGLKDLIPALVLSAGLAFTPVASEAGTRLDSAPQKVDKSISYQNFRRLIRRLQEAFLGVTGPAYV